MSNTLIILATVLAIIVSFVIAFVVCQSWLWTEMNHGNDDFLAEVARKNVESRYAENLERVNAYEMKRRISFDQLVEEIRHAAAVEKLAADAKHRDDIANAVVAKLIESGIKSAP